MNQMRAGMMVSLYLALASGALAQRNMHHDQSTTQGLPAESGQSAFAAIHEIVAMLEADPKTDWSKVDIDALRQHLIDMDNVTLHATIAYESVPPGEIIHVTGNEEVRDSIQRMIMMHAAMAGDTREWHLDAIKTAAGADVTVTPKSVSARQKIRALGLLGMMAEGVHHQRHHWMIARGTM